MVEITIDDQPAEGPGDVMLEIRFTETELIAWDPEGATEVGRASLDQYTDENRALRAAILSLAHRITENRAWVEGEGC